MQATRGTSLSSTTPTARSGYRLVFAAVALAAYAVDVVTKLLAVSKLTDHEPVQVVGTLLQLDLVRNPGAAFSTGTSYTLILSVIALVAAVTVIRVGRRLGDRTWAIGLGLLLAGVLGNLTDRVFREPGFLRGHVVDFLELPHWPVFNVADMLIDVGVILILVQSWRAVPITGRRVVVDDIAPGGSDDPADDPADDARA
jgi:signal peptidase II